MPVRAVLIDVGGPLDTEVSAEALIDRQIRLALSAEGIDVSDEEYEAANRWAIDSFAWNTYQAIFWRLSGGDREMAARFRHFSDLEDAFQYYMALNLPADAIITRNLRDFRPSELPVMTARQWIDISSLSSK